MTQDSNDGAEIPNRPTCAEDGNPEKRKSDREKEQLPDAADREGALFDTLPDQPKPEPVRPASVASSQPHSATSSEQLDAFDAPAAPARPGRYEVVASGTPGIFLIDPFAIEPEPFNGRGLAVFVQERNRELIDDMRTNGNTVPVRLRPRADGQGWSCPSGSRRVNAAREIAAERPEFRVRAIIDDGMTDAEAYALCLADNHGRSEVTPLQRGREIRWAIEHLHGGSRKAYIEHHRIDSSVVSRALDLIDLPEDILACAQDREALPTLFAEKLAPRLKDRAERKAILARAKALKGDQLSAPRLLAYLLTGVRTGPSADRQTIWLGSGRERMRASATVAVGGAATFKVPPSHRLSAQQKEELRAFVIEQVDKLLKDGRLSNDGSESLENPLP